jgi:hypothetical protein
MCMHMNININMNMNLNIKMNMIMNIYIYIASTVHIHLHLCLRLYQYVHLYGHEDGHDMDMSISISMYLLMSTVYWNCTSALGLLFNFVSRHLLEFHFYLLRIKSVSIYFLISYSFLLLFPSFYIRFACKIF